MYIYYIYVYIQLDGYRYIDRQTDSYDIGVLVGYGVLPGFECSVSP